MDNFNIFNNFNMPQKQAGLVGQNQAANQNQPINQAPLQPLNNQAQNLQNLLFQEPAMVYQPVFDYDVLMMKDDAVLKFIQNLLKMPESVDKFIAELQTNPKNAEAAAKIIMQNLVNVKALNELINQNSEVAIQKLYETITNVLKTGTKDINQLKEIMSFLNHIQTSTNVNPNSIKEFLLLYLPFELQEYKNFTNSVEAKEALTLDKDHDVSIMIQTVSFSNILCAIKEDKNDLSIDLYSTEDFPYETFLKFISYMARQLTLQIKVEHHIKADDSKNDKQSFNVASRGSIPINALILAQFIIKTIFKIDKDFI